MTTLDRGLPWATAELGLVLEHHGSTVGRRVGDLVRPGLRKNPRRAHLLVSTVLGKHIPTDPAEVIDAGRLLGSLCEGLLGPDPSNVVVLGFAETATGLGNCVATRLDASTYLHSTRRNVAAVAVLGGFEEGHSHATSHKLMPTSADLLSPDLPMVLVDDEISTGTTALEAISALHAIAPRAHYVIASLVDMRTPEHLRTAQDFANRLATRIDSVCLATGAVRLPDGLTDAVAALPDAPDAATPGSRGRVTRVETPWPAAVPDGGRHGFLRADRPAFDAAITAAAENIASALDPDRPAVVIGHEELMYLPLRLADALAASRPVLFQTSTRSPAYVLDEPGYPLRRGFRFLAPEPDADAPRYLYNAQFPDSNAQLVLVVDGPADTDALTGPGGLVDVLTAAGEDVVVAVVSGADPAALLESRR